MKAASALALAKAVANVICGGQEKTPGQSGKFFKPWFRHAAIRAKDEVIATQRRCYEKISRYQNIPREIGLPEKNFITLL